MTLLVLLSLYLKRNKLIGRGLVAFRNLFNSFSAFSGHLGVGMEVVTITSLLPGHYAIGLITNDYPLVS